MQHILQTVSFPGIGIGELTIDRVAFTVFDKPIYWYGVIFASAFLLAILYVLKRSKTFGLNEDHVMDVIIGAIIGGIVGARAYYVIFTWEDYKDNLLNIFNLRLGGIAMYGGVIGGFLVLLLVCRWRKVKLLPMTDLTVGGLILGQAIGRWGNFVNIEAFGGNTTAPWGMVSPTITDYLARNQAALAAQGMIVDPNMPVHPTFFYESIWCLLGFLVIAWFTSRRRFDGEITLIYAIWYGIGRAVIEGLRTDSLMWGSIRVSQALAVVMVIAAACILVYVRSNIKKVHNDDPEYLKRYADTEESALMLAGLAGAKGGKSGKNAAIAESEALKTAAQSAKDATETTEETSEAVKETTSVAGEPLEAAGEMAEEAEEAATETAEEPETSGAAIAEMAEATEAAADAAAEADELAETVAEMTSDMLDDSEEDLI